MYSTDDKLFGGIVMGYTHYWKFNLDYEINSEKWKEIVDDFNKILDVEIDIPSKNDPFGPTVHPYFDVYDGTGGMTSLRNILEPYSNQKLEITDEEIRFNGREEGDRGHETFSLQRKSDKRLEDYASRLDRKYIFDFCKTARKPYDIVVCCLLVILKHRLGNMIEISSDGKDWTNDEGKYYEIDGAWSDAIKICVENLSYDLNYDDILEHLFDEFLMVNYRLGVNNKKEIDFVDQLHQYGVGS